MTYACPADHRAGSPNGSMGRPGPLARAGGTLGLLLALLPGLPGHGRAQSLQDAETLLYSGEAEEVEAGIQALGLVGSPEAADLLVQRTEFGLPAPQLDTAILTLGALGAPTAVPLLTQLSRHRRPEIRSAALLALGAFADTAEVEPALIRGLSDADEGVRTAAAEALAQAGTEAAVPTLLRALDRGNLAAAPAVGRLVPAGEATRIIAYLGKLPLHSLSGAIAELLVRDDVHLRTRLRAVGRLSELATPEVRTFLAGLLAERRNQLAAPVRKAMLEAMESIAP